MMKSLNFQFLAVYAQLHYKVYNKGLGVQTLTTFYYFKKKWFVHKNNFRLYHWAKEMDFCR